MRCGVCASAAAAHSPSAYPGAVTAAPATTEGAAGPATARTRRRVRVVLAVLAIVAANVAVYAALATPPAQDALAALAGWTYPGVFLLSLVANAGVFLPIPYNAVVLQVVASAELPFLVAVAAAAGSALSLIHI